MVLVCWPCSRRLGPLDRRIGHLTEVGWPVQWSVGLGCRGRRTAFLAPVWGVGVVRGAGRRGSVACAAVCFYVCIDVLICILDVF